MLDVNVCFNLLLIVDEFLLDLFIIVGVFLVLVEFIWFIRFLLLVVLLLVVIFLFDLIVIYLFLVLLEFLLFKESVIDLFIFWFDLFLFDGWFMILFLFLLVFVEILFILVLFNIDCLVLLLGGFLFKIGGDLFICIVFLIFLFWFFLVWMFFCLVCVMFCIGLGGIIGFVMGLRGGVGGWVRFLVGVILIGGLIFEYCGCFLIIFIFGGYCLFIWVMGIYWVIGVW